MTQLREMEAAPALHRSELMERWKDAKSQKDLETQRRCEEALNRGCPGWNVPDRQKHAGSRRTGAVFKDKSRDFEYAKDAYIWLVGQFARTDPGIFSDQDHRLLSFAPGKGGECNYFARSTRVLFKRASHLAEDPTKFYRLSNGWYVNLVLNNDQKFTILTRFGGAIGVSFKKDWDFIPDDPTAKLQARFDMFAEIAAIDVTALLAELFDL